MQVGDHVNDTDDVVPEIESKLYLQLKDHENDTDDVIPDNEVTYVQLSQTQA